MSPVFRRYCRPLGNSSGVTFAIADVGYLSPPQRVSVRRFPIKLGYHNRASASRLTFDDVEESLHLEHGYEHELIEVIGFVQLKPRSERKGMYLTKEAQKRARLRQLAEEAAKKRRNARAAKRDR